MAVVVADSDVLIDALRGRAGAAARIAAELRSGTLTTTVINVFELTSGAKSEKERDKVERLLGPATVLPLDEGSSRLAGELRRRLEKRGQPIGMADYLVAGICLSHSAVLLTRNTAHFGRVPGLELGNLSA